MQLQSYNITCITETCCYSLHGWNVVTAEHVAMTRARGASGRQEQSSDPCSGPASKMVAAEFVLKQPQDCGAKCCCQSWQHVGLQQCRVAQEPSDSEERK